MQTSQGNQSAPAVSGTDAVSFAGWKVCFTGTGKFVQMDRLRSCTKRKRPVMLSITHKLGLLITIASTWFAATWNGMSMARWMTSWLDDELEECQFADARLGKWFRTLLEKLSKAIGETIPLAC
jgi:Transposase DNA-binding